MKDSRKILVVIATFIEAEALWDLKIDRHETFMKDRTILGAMVDVLITGVGPLNAFIATDKVLNENNYDLIINLGIGGTLTTRLSIGEAVIVSEEKLAMPLFESDDKFENEQDLSLQPSAGLFLNDNRFLWQADEFMSNLKRGIGLTTGVVFNDVKRAHKMNKRFGADIESMEGAAVLMACNKHRVTMIEIRTISNVAGDRDKRNWNMPGAMERLGVITKKLFEWLKE